jgi:hypothetical protein
MGWWWVGGRRGWPLKPISPTFPVALALAARARARVAVVAAPWRRAASTATVLQGVTQVRTKEAAAAVVTQLLAAAPGRVFAVDTEVCNIEVTEQSPVGNGYVTCASVYGGPDLDFGTGPRLWIDNLDDAAGTLEVLKPFLESTSALKVRARPRRLGEFPSRCVRCWPPDGLRQWVRMHAVAGPASACTVPWCGAVTGDPHTCWRGAPAGSGMLRQANRCLAPGCRQSVVACWVAAERAALHAVAATSAHLHGLLYVVGAA